MGVVEINTFKICTHNDVRTKPAFVCQVWSAKGRHQGDIEEEVYGELQGAGTET